MSSGSLFFYGCFHAGLVYSWRWDANDKAGLPVQILKTDRTERNSPMQVQPKRSGFFAMILRSAALCFPVILVACSASNSSSNPLNNPPPVNAQTTYSNAALSGTYSISTGINSETGTACCGETVIPIAGTLQFDGNGNITGGSIQYPVPGLAASQTRQYSVKGTYSVSSSASGTAVLAFTFTGGNTDQQYVPFLPTTPFSFTLQAAQQGASVILAESDGLQYISVIALKQ